MDAFIDKLCDDLEPVKCTRHPFFCSSTLIILSAVVTVLLTLYMGIREDVAEAVRNPNFVFEILLAAVIGVSATYCAALLRVPDMRGQKWMLAVPFTLLGVFILWKVIYIALGYFEMPHLDFHHCMEAGMMLAILPAVFMFLMVARGFTAHPVLMAVMNGLGIAAVGYLALRFTCTSEDLGHTLYTHLLPFIVVGSVFGLLARRLYRW